MTENEKRKIRYEKNKERLKEKSRIYQNEWRKNNPDLKKERDKKYREKFKEQIRDKQKIIRELNKDRSIKYRELHKEEIKEYNRVYKENRLKTDPLYKLIKNVRQTIKRSFNNKGYKKNSKSEQILGCSFEEFKQHLESKFEPWMNWSNHGLYNSELNYGWDIDHIIPISLSKTVEDVLKNNHYTNLQPLCSKVNRDIKKNKLII